MSRYSIILSVEEYKHFNPTNFTHADSELIYDTLTEKCDYSKHHTLHLKLAIDDGKDPAYLLDEIRKVVSKSIASDSILFYFAGHGHYEDGKTYLILPNTVPGAYESTALALEDISKELRIPGRACFRIFDACHSGLDVRDGNEKLDPGSFIREVTHDAEGWVTLAACSYMQASIGDPKIGHGVFTYYLCNYIDSLSNDEDVYPELLKINIADDVFNHSKNLGYTQTPTLNASISGNISLAKRRAVSVVKPTPKDKNEEDISERIARLRSIKNILTNENLESLFGIIVDQCGKNLNNSNLFEYEVTKGEPILADDIPKAMQAAVVDFSKEAGLEPRHDLIRVEEEYEEHAFASILSSLYPKKKKKYVSYEIFQSSDLPKSALVFNLKGDGKCVPNVHILLYLIPLQITACILVSVFKEGWEPFESQLKLVRNLYQIINPDDQEEKVREIGPFSSDKTFESISKLVTERVNQLERELSGSTRR